MRAQLMRATVELCDARLALAEEKDQTDQLEAGEFTESGRTR